MVGLVASGPEVETFVLGKMAFEGPDMRRDTIFRIASMTRPVTATAVMMLVEEGKLRLDEPVDRLLPELANRGVLRRIDAALDDTVPARRPIRVEDLLTFRGDRARPLSFVGETSSRLTLIAFRAREWQESQGLGWLPAEPG